ncbi:hypothetical protein H0H81_005614 [Sphagnurus paluster]|uniref:Deacetylase sirtuin-type domain-containing protein n=1 Tax=Sphagnurus paluster TaxID=117069 RepID=A0A9P7KM57_9AGAR|nr:hypothetical protein H0H81_005614 [Sphagnurus paluster]
MTTLQSNLARFNLPFPEAVFNLDFFRRNPVPFYTLAAELYPGAFRPTPTHAFIKLLSDKGLLHTCFTQNIDNLERIAGVPENKIVEAHGSFASQHCIECKALFDGDEMRQLVLGKYKDGEPIRIPRYQRVGCAGLVKPDIVFFGEQLPERFKASKPFAAAADLLLILGTSLTVTPFSSLATIVHREHCPRILINPGKAGNMGQRKRDVVLLGKCDEIVRELCMALGWSEDLERMWATMGKQVELADQQERAKAENAVTANNRREFREDQLDQRSGSFPEFRVPDRFTPANHRACLKQNYIATGSSSNAVHPGRQDSPATGDVTKTGYPIEPLNPNSPIDLDLIGFSYVEHRTEIAVLLIFFSEAAFHK